MNPRAATNDLLPFQGSPFSHLVLLLIDILYLIIYQERREWDSNPRALADKRFSRPPRYDHFDISPNVLSYYITLLFHLSRTFLFFFLNFLCFFIKEKSFKAVTFRLFLLFSAAVLSGNERYSITVFDRSQLFFSSFLFFS